MEHGNCQYDGNLLKDCRIASDSFPEMFNETFGST